MREPPGPHKSLKMTYYQILIFGKIAFLVILALDRPKNTFIDPNFGPVYDKNAMKTHF